MKPPKSYTEIPPAQIAIEENIDLDSYRFWENRRWLKSYADLALAHEDPTLVYFGNYTDLTYERMQLIDALELRITPDDPEVETRVRFKWDILAYNRDYIWL